MSRERDEAMQVLAETDWSGATVERERRPVSVIHSVRFPAEVSDRLEAEAERRGLTPSALVRELVEAGLSDVDDNTTVTVRVADLHRAIDRALHRAA
jgi:predicted DNA-binding protein